MTVRFADLYEDMEMSVDEMKNISCCGKTMPAEVHGTPYRDGSYLSMVCPICTCRVAGGWTKYSGLDAALTVEPCAQHRG
ncbi:hypothetical protein ACWCXH_14375 [Kitasatospora sp. NPDC001660]